MLVIIKSETKKDSYLKELSFIKKQSKDVKMVLCDDYLEGYNCQSYGEGINLNKVEDLKYHKVILIGFSTTDKIEHFYIYDAFTKNIDGIFLINNGLYTEYHPNKNKHSDTLLVFPGAILPLNMGSHQRAFNLLHAINENESGCDVLITAGNDNHKIKAERCLKSIVPNVFTYSNKKRKLPKLLRIRRKLEVKYNNIILKKDNREVPEIFSDRLHTRATFSLKRTLKKIVETKKYKNIIISYAWLSHALDLIGKDVLDELNIICDTHDVQYIRDSSGEKTRNFVSNRMEKHVEIKELKKYDKVMAISISDAEELKKRIDDKKVLTVTSNFDYAYMPIKKVKMGDVIDFGFIGGRMDANVQSLKYILEQWWPTIREYSPESKIYIAGSICNEDSIRDLAFMDSSVKLLGFVDSLRSFYSKFHVSLNPVFVQGGLNFKSVEALSAGKVLVTNSLGIKCLGDENLASIIDSKDELISFLIKLETDKMYFNSQCRRAQNLSFNYFSGQKPYKELQEVLIHD